MTLNDFECPIQLKVRLSHAAVCWLIVSIRVHLAYYIVIQEAQLPQRDSASATHVFLGSLTDRALHWAPHPLLYNRLAKLVSTLSANKPCDIRTLSWIGHSRSFNFPCSPGSRWMAFALWATKSEDVGLIVRAISFQDFQPMWSWSTNVTDRRSSLYVQAGIQNGVLS